MGCFCSKPKAVNYQRFTSCGVPGDQFAAHAYRPGDARPTRVVKKTPPKTTSAVPRSVHARSSSSPAIQPSPLPPPPPMAHVRGGASATMPASFRPAQTKAARSSAPASRSAASRPMSSSLSLHHSAKQTTTTTGTDSNGGCTPPPSKAKQQQQQRAATGLGRGSWTTQYASTRSTETASLGTRLENLANGNTTHVRRPIYWLQDGRGVGTVEVVTTENSGVRLRVDQEDVDWAGMDGRVLAQ
ncbi:hypothetical protein F4779DRAFT_216785 [Xylariaceae sp. FL0662B]|nr:hypothetical protein F4779DRAFT_216785 [Xylariaceae sp. FL0662B]